MGVSITKDRKSRCFWLAHKRCGITEGIWLTPEEIIELKKLLEDYL